MLVVWELEAHYHSRPRSYWFLGADEQSAGADVGHVSSNSRRTAAAVCEFKFDLSANRGTFETSPFQLSRTSHIAPSALVCAGMFDTAPVEMDRPMEAGCAPHLWGNPGRLGGN
jgi:hypothetical protein